MATTKEQAKFWEKLSERERHALVGLGGFLCFLVIVVAVVLFQRHVAEIEDSTRRYADALDFLAAAGPAYAERLNAESAEGTHKKIDDETLTNNDIKLTSFVAEHAEKAEITVSSYDEDQIPYGNKNTDGPIVVERQLRVEIRNAEMNDLVQMLDLIERSPEPVFVKRLDIRGIRKNPGEVRAVLTISTFTKKQQES